ncbi:hypothetical protein B9Q06_07855 [Candidatus Marsarchaeota G2 archaeon ECH_B_2]|jgi:hypothetical protein|uniref:Uncharacterized protein n=3 Tax=Candidatus Marsarchaeota group 2 TaxID=2203771 RepID=A0A2R6B805_9ARCH|nr:MAG: hypothetical protein B9Q06_07855 [Candidatus Marsarchaeota G2 archaeon ECH_B_2]PSN99241.1 MAG: hypothetical protein B9Q07_07330 [Candidatus Marsarchaeota G2 archaeon ECH_B_3]PSO01576.1 MAG: hypothetical protein B9Q05_08565 [Candidatus Marsarchaeota G2 archaeon ECH_B_1]
MFSVSVRSVIGEVVRWGWTYIFIGLWFTIGGSYSADGLEAVLGVILVFYGALLLDRKAKKLEEELERIRSKKDG